MDPSAALRDLIRRMNLRETFPRTYYGLAGAADAFHEVFRDELEEALGDHAKMLAEDRLKADENLAALLAWKQHLAEAEAWALTEDALHPSRRRYENLRAWLTWLKDPDGSDPPEEIRKPGVEIVTRAPAPLRVVASGEIPEDPDHVVPAEPLPKVWYLRDSPAYQTPKGTPYLRGPGVALIAKTQTDLRGIQAFLDGFLPSLGFGDYLKDPVVLTDGAQLAKFAGQLCYASFGPQRTMNADADTYFENIRSSGHGSVCEHASYTFLLWGVSRTFTHELVRHRVGTAYSQLSQRYVGGAAVRFVERVEFFGAKLHALFEARVDQVSEAYEMICNALTPEVSDRMKLARGDRTAMRKKVRQAARAALTGETEAPIVLTMNARTARQTIATRGSEHAEPEIREVFVTILEALRDTDPPLFADFTIGELPDGTRYASTPTPKV